MLANEGPPERSLATNGYSTWSPKVGWGLPGVASARSGFFRTSPGSQRTELSTRRKFFPLMQRLASDIGGKETLLTGGAGFLGSA